MYNSAQLSLCELNKLSKVCKISVMYYSCVIEDLQDDIKEINYIKNSHVRIYNWIVFHDINCSHFFKVNFLKLQSIISICFTISDNKLCHLGQSRSCYTCKLQHIYRTKTQRHFSFRKPSLSMDAEQLEDLRCDWKHLPLTSRRPSEIHFQLLAASPPRFTICGICYVLAFLEMIPPQIPRATILYNFR